MNKFLLQILRLACVSFLLLNQSLYAQQIDDKRKIIAQYDSLNRFLPKEKLYVHFDKSIYTTQDTIWFKAYLLDEKSKIPSPIERFDLCRNDRLQRRCDQKHCVTNRKWHYLGEFTHR
ncbi:hypothetical protein [Pedobacter sp. UC225_65]|uniref:hypothetical protein n=1 Tax=Pedobacter sp. UC225_65 TaxID=3350173 RepID=UPI00366CA388